MKFFPTSISSVELGWPFLTYFVLYRCDDISIPINRTKLTKNKRKELYAIFQLATEPKQYSKLLKGSLVF